MISLWHLVSFAWLLVAAACSWGSRRLSSQGRPYRAGALALLGGVLALRVLLFENGVAWSLYEALLPRGVLDHRLRDALLLEQRRWLPAPEGVRFVAFGGSQISTTFGKISRQRPDLERLDAAGLRPPDLEAYLPAALRTGAPTLLLIAGPIDLLGAPWWAGSRANRALGWRWPAHAAILARTLPPREAARPLFQSLLLEFSPEARHAPLLRRLRDHYLFERLPDWLAGERAPGTAVPITYPPPPPAWWRPRRPEEEPPRYPEGVPFDAIPDLVRPELRARIQAPDQLPYLRYLDLRYLALNHAFLARFFHACVASGRRVVVLESQLHPALEAALPNDVRGPAEQAFAELVAMPGLEFVPADGDLRLAPSEFKDLTHPDDEGGLRIAQNLLARLGAPPPPPPAGASPHERRW